MNEVQKKIYCHPDLNKWGPNGIQWGQKTEKGPHGDTGLQMGTHLGAVLTEDLNQFFLAFFGFLLHISLLILNSFFQFE